MDFARPGKLKGSMMTARPNEPAVHKLAGTYNPQSVISKVYNAKDSTGKKLVKAHFFNLETYKISALIPEIRFYKTDGKKYVPFYFPISTIADEAATDAGRSRTKGSGITKFSVSFTGTDPFTAPRYLESSLTLYVDNLSNLFDVNPGYAPLADLFTISIAKGALKREINGSTVTSGDLVRPIEVAATLGYVIPDATMAIFTQEEIKEIQSTNLSLRMNVMHHNISVNQDGSATIDIRYTARIDSTARDRIFSSTDTPTDILKRANIRQLFSPEEKDIQSTNKNAGDKVTASVRKSQIDKAIELRKILDILERTNRIHSIEARKEDIRIYTQIGVPKEDKKDREETPGEEEQVTNKKPKTPESKIAPKKAKTLDERIQDLDLSKRSLYYITFGDMMEAFFVKTLAGLLSAGNILDNSKKYPNIADNSDEQKKAIAASLGLTDSQVNELAAIAEKSNSEKNKIAEVIMSATKKLSSFRILLADVEYKYFTEFEEEEAVRRINLADVPISLETYQEFMFDKVVNSYRNTYTIPQFIEDCVSSLLPKVFGQTWSNAGIASKVISAPPKFTSTTYTAPELKKSLSRRSVLAPSDIPGAQKNFRASNIADESDYFLIYQAVDRELAGDRNGQLDEDSRDGIYHFLLGKDRGLIKEITFSRFEAPYAQEQLMTNQVGLYDELKLPYSANITMVGNNLFMPGSQIYINPSNIGMGSSTDVNSPAFRIGLGGYYTVLDVTTDFDGEKLTTTMACSFGSHAKDRKTLTGNSIKERLLGEIDRNSVSNDAEPQEIPELNTDLVEVSQAHYLTQLQTLKDPSTGQTVLDSVVSRQIANDYVLHRESNVTTIPGVLGKEINQNTGAVRYNLDRGDTIEIDDSRPTTKAVSLVRRRRPQNGR